MESQTYQPPVVYLQNACLLHRNPRNKVSPEATNASERPERLHFANAGLASLYARLEDEDASTSSSHEEPLIRVIRSNATVESIPDHQAAAAILHVKTETNSSGSPYAETLKALCDESQAKIRARERELPPEYEEDLYREF